MTRTAFVLDAGALPHEAPDDRNPLWWGFVGMIAIESTVFASLIASYFYIRMGAEAWPPEPLPLPDLILPTLNTLVLLASSGTMVWADRSIKRGDVRRLAIALTAGIVLALVFLALKAFEYMDEVSFRWYEHAYGSIVWTIVGFHSAHVIALVLKTIVVTTLAWKAYFDRERRVAVTVNGIYWHFVVAVWIPLYLVLYWVPRLR
jgi:cytochrome c oxidase subunit 3